MKFVADATQQVMSIRYAEMASSMIILYDHLITLDVEIDLIWRSGWSLGKCLFLLNRYYTLFVVIFNNYILFSPKLTNDVSLAWFRWQGVTGIIAFVLGELILQLRLYAMYYLEPKVLAVMFVTFVAAVAASSTMMGISLHGVKALSVVPLTDLNFCIPFRLPSFFYSFWIPILASESLLCCLAVWRGYKSYRHQRSAFRPSQNLIDVLIRDSVLYFLMLFSVYLCNAVIFIIGHSSQVESSIGYSVAFSCVMANRLCLNVRGMIRNDDGGSTLLANELPGIPARRPTLLRSTGSRSKSGSRVDPNVVVVTRTSVGSMPLTEFEMDELRTMRVA